MAKKNGTLELIGKEISNALRPLEQRLAGGDIQLFFLELGLRFPDGFETTGSFIDDLNDTIALAAQLPTLIGDLKTAVDAEDTAGIIEAIAEIGIVVADLVASLDDIKTGLDAIAGSIAGLSSSDVLDFATDLAKKLLEYTLILYLEGYHPVFNSLLTLIGVVEYTEVQGDETDANKVSYVKRELYLGRIADLLSDPKQLMIDLYGWGDDPNFDGNKFIKNLHNIVFALGLPAEYIAPEGSEPAKLGFRQGLLIPRDDLTPKGLEFQFINTLEGGFIYETPNFIPSWRGEFDIDVSVGAQTSLLLQPGGKITFIPPSGEVEGDLKFSIVGEPEPGDDELIIFGQSSGSRVSAEKVKAGVRLLFDWDSMSGQADGSIGFEASVQKGRIIIDSGGGDGFLAKVLPNGIEAEFDFILGWDSERGFYFGGSASLEVAVPVHKSFLGLELETLYLRLTFDNGSIIPEVSADTRLELGPFTAVINRMGVEAEISPEDGNLGPMNASLGFKPPNGIGLSIDASAVKGGGFLFFDFDEEKYAGVAELTVKDTISLKAIGILTTKLPGNDDGYSLLLLVTAEFTPIQLGFGFTLNGVGGLVALNRSMDLQALRDGVKDNSIDNVMFPDDPVANAPQIISDLERIFPIQEGRYAFGVMGLIGWGTPTLISMEIGLMLEVPSPVRLAILGVIKAILPTEEKDLLKLQINFVGTIDFEAKYITFDASLFDSRLLTFTLAGDMAFRLKWGDEPNFLFSIGGFHPAYTPPPLNLPTLQRLTINLLGGNNPRLTLTTYFALTSNTVQFGSAVDFYFKVTGKVVVVGGFGFDVLIQFSPFYLRADIYAMLAVLYKNKSLFSVSLSGMLEGPAPWHAQGKAEFKVLGIKLKANFDKTFGENTNTSLPDIDVLPKLVEEANKSQNWEGEFPAASNLLVSLKDQGENATDLVLTHPNGSLRFGQKTVPLDTTITKFGKQNPADYTSFNLEMADSLGANFQQTKTKEFFAPAEFYNLTDSQKLSRKSFEKMNAGVTATSSNEFKSGYFVERQLEYEHIVYDSRKHREEKGLLAESEAGFNAFIRNNAASNAMLGTNKKPTSAFAPNKVKVNQEQYSIANLEDLSVHTEMGEDLTFGTQAEAQIALDNLLESQPDLVDQIDVVSTYELV